MLEVGKTYIITTAGGRKATCLLNLPQSEAIFLVQGNDMTPFVAWGYKQEQDNESFVSCFHGRYYKDIVQALVAEKVIK